MSETDEREDIIVFDKVSKIYTLYKNSREQFAALFYNSKRFKRHKALEEVSFRIKKGESVAIIGRNAVTASVA